MRVFAYSIKIKFECRETFLHSERLCKSLGILSTKGLLINKLIWLLAMIVLPGPEVKSPFSCLTQLSMKVVMLINLKCKQLLPFQNLLA